MISKFNKILLALVAIVVAGTALYIYQRSRPDAPPTPQTERTFTNPAERLPELSNPEVTPELPNSLLIKVPFTPQAPTANWDELHNEACEEASVIMANAYFSNTPSLPPADVEREISALTDWQNSTFGYHLSIDTDEVVKMIEANYDLQARTAQISETTIKEALAANKLVIVPANGQMLGNPFYKAPGPIYHMFVITGYDEQGFITNDPGTKRGENYRFDYQTIRDATGNWDHDAHEVNLSDKRIIIVSKP